MVSVLSSRVAREETITGDKVLTLSVRIKKSWGSFIQPGFLQCWSDIYRKSPNKEFCW